MPLSLKEGLKINWGEVKKQCLALGFTKNKEFAENKEAFFSSANWAQNQIALYAKPILKKCVINHRALENVLQEGEKTRETRLYDGKAIVYESLWAKSFCFECDGNGICTIEDEEKTFDVMMQSEGGFKIYKGFCKGKLKMTFHGDYGFNIRNCAAYGITFSEKVEDIPVFQEYVSYDFKVIEPNFMGFALEKPILEGSSDNSYRVVSDYKREGNSVLRFKGSERGQFLVWIKVYPTAITADTNESYEMELDRVACEIVPYLMGFRLWLDDDIQKAVLYQNVAEDLINKMIVAQEAEKKMPAFVDVRGAVWLS